MEIPPLFADPKITDELLYYLSRPLLFNQAIAEYGRRQSEHNNVVGYALGRKATGGVLTDQLSIVVFVRQKLPLSEIPAAEQIRTQFVVNPERLSEIDETTVYRVHPEILGIDGIGIPTDVQAIGTPSFDASGTYIGYQRPLRAGISVGWRTDITGTLGCFVRDKVSGKVCILSAAHVFGNFTGASHKDLIIQPGGDDGGRINYKDPKGIKPQDYYHVASFIRSAPVTLASTVPPNTNMVDAAIAELIRQDEYRSRIEGGVGIPTGEGRAAEGMLVHKTGRMSGYTVGKITSIKATFRMSVGAVDVPFTDLLVTTVMSKPGDSGSLLLSSENNLALGLLMGSSDNRSFFSKFSNVATVLNIELP